MIRVVIKYSDYVPIYRDKDIDIEKVDALLEDFTYYIRSILIRSLRELESSPPYLGKWEPVDDEAYLQYLGIPKVTKPLLSLIESKLSVRSSTDSYILYIPTSYTYPRSRRRLIDVIESVEKGTETFEGRPLIYHAVANLDEDLPKLWSSYLVKRRLA